MKHKHAELIKLWLEDTSLEFECRLKGMIWTNASVPLKWDESVEYRVKPKPFNPGKFTLTNIKCNDLYYLECEKGMIIATHTKDTKYADQIFKFIMEKLNA